jgi:hypothetical protein
MEYLQIVILLLNTGILTGIYYKLGSHDAKHISHEKRLDNLERKYNNAA